MPGRSIASYGRQIFALGVRGGIEFLCPVDHGKEDGSIGRKHNQSLALSLMAPGVHAAPILSGTATYEYFNQFTTRLFPGTPFNETSEPIDAPVVSNGVLTTVWEDQVGDTINFEIVSIVQSGVFGGLPYEILGRDVDFD
jgi:hypothetical protein